VCACVREREEGGERLVNHGFKLGGRIKSGPKGAIWLLHSEIVFFAVNSSVLVLFFVFQLSPATLQGLHQIVQMVQIGDYTGGLNLHTQLVSGSDFSQIASFMPGLKVLLQSALQLQVYLQWSPSWISSFSGKLYISVTFCKPYAR